MKTASRPARRTRPAWALLPLLGLSLAGTTGRADELERLRHEVDELRTRLERIEGGATQRHDGEGHKLHPLHSAYGARVAGGYTAVVQGTLGNERRYGGDGADAAMSADLYLELPVEDRGLFLLRLDLQQGAGLTRLPPLFTAPNGNPTGPNADVESWNSAELHVAEARYEHSWGDGTRTVVVGHIDLTAYFDNNEFANSETTQYLAQQFVNNAAIEWGGNDNFYGPGLVFLMEPRAHLELALGWFEGDGDYAEMFRRPFLIGQLELKTGAERRKTHYRVYAWQRQTPHCRSAADPALFADCALVAAADRIPLQDNNTGFGLSLDRELEGGWGLWGRVGYQDPDVAQFSQSYSLGAVKTGVAGRVHDRLGLGYGVNLPSGAYETATAHGAAEHYLELYYKYVWYGDGVGRGIHLTPDLQFVTQPAGDGQRDTLLIPGLRLQVHF